MKSSPWRVDRRNIPEIRHEALNSTPSSRTPTSPACEKVGVGHPYRGVYIWGVSDDCAMLNSGDFGDATRAVTIHESGNKIRVHTIKPACRHLKPLKPKSPDLVQSDIYWTATPVDIRIIHAVPKAKLPTAPRGKRYRKSNCMSRPTLAVERRL